MFEAYKRLNCFGHYTKDNNFCLHCKIAVECYNRTNEMRKKGIRELRVIS